MRSPDSRLVPPGQKRRNTLTDADQYKLTRLIDRMSPEILRDHLTRAEVAERCGKTLGFPVTVSNISRAEHMLGKTLFPWGGSPRSGSRPNPARDGALRALAAAIVHLYGIAGNEQDCPPEVRLLAGILIESEKP